MKKILVLVLALSIILTSFSMVFASEQRFSDVPDDAWFSGYVKTIVEADIMTGYDESVFGAEDLCTRAQLVTILYRLSGSPKVEVNDIFTDVDLGEYYTEAIAWAKENGITNGNDDGSFGVDEPLSRSHIVAFLYRYAKISGINTTKKADISYFEDYDITDDYAKEPFSWAVALKIVNGTSNKTLSPNENATRAEVAAILSRTLEIKNHEHSYNAGELIKAPTDTEDGEILYTCKICGESKTDVAPKGTKIYTREDIEKAVADTAWAYCMKKGAFQYDSLDLDTVGRYYSGRSRTTEGSTPEDGTKDTTTYSVCSDYVYSVYDEGVGYNIFGGSSLDVVTRLMWMFPENQPVFGTGEYMNPGDPKDDVDSVLIRWVSDEYMDTDDAKADIDWGVFDSKHFVNTKEEFQQFLLDWKDTMRPGDVLVNKGHAELYIGNGKYLDANGQKYDPEANVEKYEPSGTVYRTDVVLDHPERQEWLDWFTKSTRLVVFRPSAFLCCEDTDGNLANDMVIDKAWTMPEKTETRMKYPAMNIDRTASITPYETAYEGEELTYNIEISNNTNDHNYLFYMNEVNPEYQGQKYEGLVVTETIPSGTKLVDNSITNNGIYENGKIKWTVDLNAGEKIDLSYKVIVTAKSGEVIVNDGGYVENIPSNTLKHYVYGEKLNDKAKETLKNISESDTSTWTYETGSAFANSIYTAMGVDVEIPSVAEITDNIFEFKTINRVCRSVRYKGGEERKVFMLKDSVSPAYQNVKDMMINGYYGGYNFFTGADKRQTTINEFRMSYIEPGDIFYYINTDENGEITGVQVMVYAGDGTLLSSNADGTYSVFKGDEADSELWKAFMKKTNLFFALRPTQAK